MWSESQFVSRSKTISQWRSTRTNNVQSAQALTHVDESKQLPIVALASIVGTAPHTYSRSFFSIWWVAPDYAHKTLPGTVFIRRHVAKTRTIDQTARWTGVSMAT